MPKRSLRKSCWENEEAFGIALSNALNDAKLGENGTLLISSGLLFLLVALYYNIEISSPSADAVQYKDRLLTWSEKYQITDAQIDTEQNADKYQFAKLTEGRRW